MDKAELEKRTKQFALKVIQFVATLPQTRTGARADFIHKIAIVEKECSESGFWIEICAEANLGNP